MKCPNCDLEQTDSNTECPRCGVAFSKLGSVRGCSEAPLSGHGLRPQPDISQERPVSTSRPPADRPIASRSSGPPKSRASGVRSCSASPQPGACAHHDHRGRGSVCS